MIKKIELRYIEKINFQTYDCCYVVLKQKQNKWCSKNSQCLNGKSHIWILQTEKQQRQKDQYKLIKGETYFDFREKILLQIWKYDSCTLFVQTQFLFSQNNSKNIIEKLEILNTQGAQMALTIQFVNFFKSPSKVHSQEKNQNQNIKIKNNYKFINRISQSLNNRKISQKILLKSVLQNCQQTFNYLQKKARFKSNQTSIIFKRINTEGYDILEGQENSKTQIKKFSKKKKSKITQRNTIRQVQKYHN